MKYAVVYLAFWLIVLVFVGKELSTGPYKDFYETFMPCLIMVHGAYCGILDAIEKRSKKEDGRNTNG